jgi:hypothetical protein
MKATYIIRVRESSTSGEQKARHLVHLIEDLIIVQRSGCHWVPGTREVGRLCVWR